MRWICTALLLVAATAVSGGCTTRREPRASATARTSDSPPVQAPPLPASRAPLFRAPSTAETARPQPSTQPSAPSPDKSIAVLREALESKDYATRLMATEALGQVRFADPAPWLEHSLGDPEHDVRIAAVEALRKQATTPALALLVSVRDDDTEALDIRALAASALLSFPNKE